MKKIILTMLLFLSSISSQAYFSINASCYINRGASAACEVCNYQYTAVRCQMRINGQTTYGTWVNRFQNLYLLPGQCAQGYVYANNAYVDPLIFANANAMCSF